MSKVAYLSGEMKKKSFAQIVQETESDLQRRLWAKMPEWEHVPGLRLPARLNVEQCSSSATARYKAEFAGRILQEAGDGGPGRIADLTGGLGVDSWAFSLQADELLFNEMDAALCDLVRHNFACLGVPNACFRSGEVRPGEVRAILAGFRPGLIYLDHARRSATGRKVFLLEDCSPDVAALEAELLACAPQLLAKLSPMADLSLLRRRLRGVSEIHVVSVNGECKELLLRMEREEKEPFRLTVTELRDGQTHSLTLTDAQRKTGCEGLEGPIGEGWLFEPGAALMKSGGHEFLCRRGGLRKLSPSTQLYLAEEGPVGELAPFGRFRRILEAVPLDKRSLKDVGRRHPLADVSARNLPLHSDELARRLGVSPGGDVHIYGTTVTTPAGSARVLLVTARQSFR